MVKTIRDLDDRDGYLFFRYYYSASGAPSVAN